MSPVKIGNSQVRSLHIKDRDGTEDAHGLEIPPPGGEQQAVEELLRAPMQVTSRVFERLFTVRYTHRYDNHSEGAYPVFSVRPTRATANLFSVMGLLFRDDGIGFSVLYDTRRQGKLRRSLEAAKESEGGYWLWMSFSVFVDDLTFYTTADIPLNTNPGRRNFYFTNQLAHRGDDGRAVLNEGETVGAEEFFPVVDRMYKIPVPCWAAQVRVYDIAGQMVLCRPCRIPVEMLNYSRAPAMITCGDVAKYRADPGWDRDTEIIIPVDEVILDFTLLAAGKYTIRFVSDPDASTVDPVSPTDGDAVIYRQSADNPLCLIDLLFTRPDGAPEGPGIFPVQIDPSTNDMTVETVDYLIEFETRSTFWDYYIVPASPTDMFRGLRVAAREASGINFTEPERVPIGAGRYAYRMSSTRQLPMQRRPAYWFALYGEIVGKRGANGDDPVLIKRLPVAAPDQITVGAGSGAVDRWIERAGTKADSTASNEEEIAPFGANPSARSPIYVYL